MERYPFAFERFEQVRPVQAYRGRALRCIGAKALELDYVDRCRRIATPEDPFAVGAHDGATFRGSRHLVQRPAKIRTCLALGTVRPKVKGYEFTQHRAALPVQNQIG